MPQPIHTNSELPRQLSLLDSIAIVIGVIIGGGIFLTPNLVARTLPSTEWILFSWIFAGIVSSFGALACAELGAAIPATGGQYVFIREAYGPMAAFLCGWSTFLVARSAQIAWLAVAFALYLSYFAPVSGWTGKLAGVGIIALFAFVNYVGVQTGALVQKIFTAAKLLGLAVIVGGAFLAAPHAAAAPVQAAPVTLSTFGVAMIACLLGYDGWIQLSYVAGEVKKPQRNILLAMVIGVSVVAAVYLLANLAYLRMMSIPEIAASDHVGASAAERAMGPLGGRFVSVLIMISIAGTLNGSFLASPRVYLAQSRDGLFFRKFGEIQPKFKTPGFAIVAQAVWSAALVLSGSYDTLATYALFATWLFYGIMAGGVIILRRTRPDLPRPYRMVGYPYTAIVFLAVTAWFLGNMLFTQPGPSFASLGLVLAGLPAYYFWRRNSA